MGGAAFGKLKPQAEFLSWLARLHAGQSRAAGQGRLRISRLQPDWKKN